MEYHKGNAITKKLLSPKLATKVIKSNKIVYLTYLGVTAAAGIGIYFINKVGDDIVAPKNKAV